MSREVIKSVNQEVVEILVTPRVFDEIAHGQENLIAIETPDCEAVVTQIQQMARRSGQSVYRWLPEDGLVSMRESETRVPGSKRMTEALRHILQSIHFGIYVFSDVQVHLRSPNSSLLRQLSKIRGSNERKVILVGDKVVMPEGLDEVTRRIAPRYAADGRPRLRDGRWVV